MRKDITISAQIRDTRGKNEARRLRVKGFTPAVVYGTGGDPQALTVNPKEVAGILKSKSGHNTIFNIDLDGQMQPVMIVDWQHDPIKGKLLHVDLKRIDPNARMIAKVLVHTHGEPRGVKVYGGLHEVITREVEVECLPDEIPEDFQLDVTEMMIGDSLRASQIPMPGSMKLLTSADAVISHVISLRNTAEAVEGAAAVAEPEVVKKGKKEDAAAAPKAAEKKDDKKKK